MGKPFRLMLLMLLFMFLPQGEHVQAAENLQQEISLIIEGEEIQPEVPPLVQKGRTLVPVRVIAEGLGADVQWDQATTTATIERDSNKVVLRLGQKKAVLNGKEVTLDTEPIIHNQRMLLPLRFVGEALGAHVGWEAGERAVLVNRALSLELNESPLPAAKVFLVKKELYLPVKQLAEQLGVPDSGQAVGQRLIDGLTYTSLSEAERLLGGRINWDKRQGLVKVERKNELKAIEADGLEIAIEMKRKTIPKHFVMTGPHRIVIDLPHTQLSKEMQDQWREKENERRSAADEEEREEGDQADQTSKDQDEDKEADRDDDRSRDADRNQDKDAAEEENKTPVDTEGDNSDDGLSLEGQESEELTADADEAQPLIAAIRYSQFATNPDTVRIVVELNQKSKYTLIETEEGFRLTLNPIPRKTGFLIMVDPGHGGKDQGAKGVTGNLEKDFNLAVGNRLVQLLQQYPEFQVLSTRGTDVYLTLQERVELANDVEADLFLSIHANSFRPETRGTETYYFNPNSQALAQVVHRHLLAATQFPDRKVKTAGFYVIKHTKMTAVLTETGFLSNAFENAKLASPDFQEKVAQALAAAVREYYLTVY